MFEPFAEDYVTEKIYDGLVAGCLPIYLGSSNIVDFLPHPKAALIYESAEQISREMVRLMHDVAEYEERVNSWRRLPLTELPQKFQEIIAWKHPVSSECRLCQKIMDIRVVGAA